VGLANTRQLEGVDALQALFVAAPGSLCGSRLHVDRNTGPDPARLTRLQGLIEFYLRKCRVCCRRYDFDLDN